MVGPARLNAVISKNSNGYYNTAENGLQVIF